LTFIALKMVVALAIAASDLRVLVLTEKSTYSGLRWVKTWLK